MQPVMIIMREGEGGRERGGGGGEREGGGRFMT